MTAPEPIRIGDIEVVDLYRAEPPGQPECHLRCSDHQGKGLLLILPDRIAQTLFSRLVPFYGKGRKIR